MWGGAEGAWSTKYLETQRFPTYAAVYSRIQASVGILQSKALSFLPVTQNKCTGFMTYVYLQIFLLWHM